MTIAVDLGRKANKQTKQTNKFSTNSLHSNNENFMCIRQLFDTCACHKLLKQHIPKGYCIARDKDEQYDVMIDLIA